MIANIIVLSANRELRTWFFLWSTAFNAKTSYRSVHFWVEHHSLLSRIFKVHEILAHRWKKNIKVEKIWKGGMDSISSRSTSAKIQIMGGKVCLRRKGKIFLGVVNKLFKIKSFLTMPSNVLPLHLKQTFPPIIGFSLKVKVMGSNPAYLLKSFLLYRCEFTRKCSSILIIPFLINFR